MILDSKNSLTYPVHVSFLEGGFFLGESDFYFRKAEEMLRTLAGSPCPVGGPRIVFF